MSSESPRKFDVFISYCHDDQIIADAVLHYLENNKIRCFIDHRDLPKGPEWPKMIPFSLRSSGLLLAIFSKGFNVSEETDREINIAANRHIPILVFRITDDDFDGAKEYYLTASNWIEAFPEPEKNFGELLNNVRLLLGITIEAEEEPTPVQAIPVREDDFLKKGLAEWYSEDGDTEMAAYHFRKSAKAGNPEGEYYLGEAYHIGRGMPYSLEKAREWFALSAEHGNPKGQCALAEFFHYGIGVERNSMKALELYDKSARQNYGRALKKLGYVFHTGELGIQDEDRSKSYYDQAFEALYDAALGENDGEAQHILGNSYMDGEGVEKNYTQAVKMYQRAVNNHIAVSYNALGICYDMGYGVEESPVKSFEFQLKSAQMGCPVGMDNVSKNYYSGIGTDANLEEYKKWVKRAVESGYHAAMVSMAWDYYTGENCEKDITKCRQMFERAIACGSVQAMNNLAILYSNGDVDCAEGIEMAFELNKKAAAGGYLPSFYSLAKCYYYGEGTEENDVEAERWYSKFAEAYFDMVERGEKKLAYPSGAGNITYSHFDDYDKEMYANTFRNLSWIYANSKTVPHDSDLARKYKKLAATLDGSEEEAKENLEMQEKVVRWRRDAMGGDAEALDKLLTYYEDDKQYLKEWSGFALKHKVYVQGVDYYKGQDNIALVLKNAVPDKQSVYLDYLKGFLNHLMEEKRYANYYSLTNAICEQVKKGKLSLNLGEMDYIRTDAARLLDDPFCAGYLRSRREHFDILFPGYFPERVASGESTGERDFKLFYASHTNLKGDNAVVDMGIKEIFAPIAADRELCKAIIDSRDAKLVHMGEFPQALSNFIDSYENLCNANPEIVRIAIDPLDFGMLVPLCRPTQVQKWGMQVMKAILSVRGLVGDKWDELISCYTDDEKILDIAEPLTDTDLQLLLVEYVEVFYEMEAFLVYSQKIQTMYLDGDKEGVADELNSYREALSEKGISHSLPEFTQENIPADAFYNK